MCVVFRDAHTDSLPSFENLHPFQFPISIKRTIFQEDITTVNIFTPNVRTHSFVNKY